MIEGYWTTLLCLMFIILLATGWRAWLQQHFNIALICLSIISIWISHIMNWTIQLKINQYEILLDSSIIIVMIVGIGFLLRKTSSNLRISNIALYGILLALVWSIVRAIIIFSPRAEANIALWYVPLASGMLIAALGITLQQIGAIIFFAAIVAEGLLLCQQRGQYVARIGNLVWWDIFSATLILGVVFILFFKILEKTTSKLMRLLLNMMKS